MLKHKAKTNLRAGEALLALGLIDPAASRYYYALFQAAVSRLVEQGRTPGSLASGAVKWSHSVVANNTYLLRQRRSDRLLFDSLRELRNQADYWPTSVDPLEVAVHAGDVREFVEEVTR
jgi:uncharacterized protein (UPF0332 family)